MIEQFLAQLADPFRIGLLLALVYTARRNVAATGTWLPLAAGVLFVAVIIPLTMQGAEGMGLAQAAGLGLVSNAVLLAVILGIWSLVARSRR